MLVLRSFVCLFTNFSKNMIAARNTASVLCLRQLHFTPIRWKTPHEGDESKKVPGPMSSQYEIFSEETAPIILDIEEEREKIDEAFEETDHDKWKEINLERGVSGVFEIEDLVEILRSENAQDLFVAKISEEFRYADYIVLVTGRSNKHMLAMTEYIRKIYKRRRNESDIVPKIEGKGSKDWMALDLGNIVLHIFSQNAREYYDLDSLWSVGKEYDPHMAKKDISTDSIFHDYANILASLTPDTPTK